jgi:hypothetical protein
LRTLGIAVAVLACLASSLPTAATETATPAAQPSLAASPSSAAPPSLARLPSKAAQPSSATLPSATVHPTSTRRHRTVFTCRERGVTVLSDRPCGPIPTARSVTTVEPPPGAVATTVPPVPHATTRPRVDPVSDPTQNRRDADRCAALRLELAEVDDRMRAGYAARESARLWERWRSLKDRLRHERC